MLARANASPLFIVYNTDRLQVRKHRHNLVKIRQAILENRISLDSAVGQGFNDVRGLINPKCQDVDKVMKMVGVMKMEY